MSNFQRASRSEPCPICHKTDWCLVASDKSTVICSRIESQKRIQRPGRDSAGWLHVLKDNRSVHPSRRHRQFRIPAAKPASPIDWQAMARACTEALRPEPASNLATSLGLPVASLLRLGLGWSEKHRAYTFPMRDASGAITGIRLRRPSGFKFAVPGSRQGLFYERLAGGRCLVVTEGPTDAVAILAMGVDAVGRASCTAGKEMTRWVIGSVVYDTVIVAADNDEPGQRGARELARHLALCHRDVRILTPPAKDVREWYRQGASADEIYPLAVRVQLKAKLTRRGF